MLFHSSELPAKRHDCILACWIVTSPKSVDLMALTLISHYIALPIPGIVIIMWRTKSTPQVMIPALHSSILIPKAASPSELCCLSWASVELFFHGWAQHHTTQSLGVENGGPNFTWPVLMIAFPFVRDQKSATLETVFPFPGLSMCNEPIPELALHVFAFLPSIWESLC